LVKQEPTLLKSLSDAPLKGRLLALPTKNRLGWKGLLGKNTLAYYGQKSFITLGPGPNNLKPFSLIFTIIIVKPLYLERVYAKISKNSSKKVFKILFSISFSDFLECRLSARRSQLSDSR
jgi:hypothetical protein